MIVIDMDMPQNCVNCNINCRHKVTAHIRYSQGQFEIPQDCPIKCDIEDIKADIQELNTYYHAPDALDKVLEIIDKQTTEK